MGFCYSHEQHLSHGKNDEREMKQQGRKVTTVEEREWREEEGEPLLFFPSSFLQSSRKRRRWRIAKWEREKNREDCALHFPVFFLQVLYFEKNEGRRYLVLLKIDQCLSARRSFFWSRKKVDRHFSHFFSSGDARNVCLRWFLNNLDGERGSEGRGTPFVSNSILLFIPIFYPMLRMQQKEGE